MKVIEIAAVVLAILVMGVVSASLRAESAAAAQIAPNTWEPHKDKPVVVVLDAPPVGYSDWGLLVRVGDAEFAIPRIELRKLALAHPDWRRVNP